MSDTNTTALADPLEAMPPPERVNYATGVLLAAEDFRDEQTYHRARLARVLAALAGFGTLAGLRVIPPEVTDAELELRVAPGIAIDRFGRTVEIARAVLPPRRSLVRAVSPRPRCAPRSIGPHA